MFMQYHSSSVAQTHEIASALAQRLHGGSVVLLEGSLGAGKTAFVQGLVSALGGDMARSPTFSVMNVYPVHCGPVTQVVHLDFYRLEDSREQDELGLEEYIGMPNTIVLAEWPPEDLRLSAATSVTRVQLVHEGNGRLITILP